MNAEIRRVVAFLEGIGIPTRRVTGPPPEHTFLTGVWVDHGTLCYRPRSIQLPSDLFHEAGHLAVTPDRTSRPP